MESSVNPNLPVRTAGVAPVGRPLYAAVLVKPANPEDHMVRCAVRPGTQTPKPHLRLPAPALTPAYRPNFAVFDKRVQELERAIATLRMVTRPDDFVSANATCCTLMRNLTHTVKIAFDEADKNCCIEAHLRQCLGRYALCQVAYIIALLNGGPALRETLKRVSVIEFDGHRPIQLKLWVDSLKIALPADNGLLHDIALHTVHMDVVHDIGRFHQQFAQALRGEKASGDWAPYKSGLNPQMIFVMAAQWDSYGHDLIGRVEPLTMPHWPRQEPVVG
jgi:hypothetical protein